MFARRRCLVLLVAATLALAGCGGSDAPDTATPSPSTTAAETATRTTATTPPATTRPTTGAVDANASAVKQRALDAMRSVESYRLRANVTRVQRGEVVRRVTAVSTGAVNRSARRLRIRQEATAYGRTPVVTTYVVNGTLYQHSAAFTRSYGSEWVRTDLAERGATSWGMLDTLHRQAVVLNASTVTLAGTATVNGTGAYVLNASLSHAQYERVVDSAGVAAANVTGATFTFWVARDGGRLLRSTGRVHSTVETANGRVNLTETFALRFTYGEPVSVTLPDAAAAAVPLDGTTTTTATGDSDDRTGNETTSTTAATTATTAANRGAPP